MGFQVWEVDLEWLILVDRARVVGDNDCLANALDPQSLTQVPVGVELLSVHT